MAEATTEKPSQNKAFDKATISSANVTDAKKELENSSTVTGNLVRLLNEIALENAVLLSENVTNINNFIVSQAESTVLSKEKCLAMLAGLKQLEIKLASVKVKTGDQAMAELAIQQVQLLKRTWEIIKESCDLTEEINKKLPIIDEKLTKMEQKSAQINKYINAYNNGEYDEEKKKIILEQINRDYEPLRTDYLQLRNEIESLKVSVNGQMVNLDFFDSQHTNSLLQNGLTCVMQMYQGCAGKSSAANVSRNVFIAANNFTQSLNAKANIAKAKNELIELKGFIDGLESRLASVKMIIEKAKAFLRENGFALKD